MPDTYFYSGGRRVALRRRDDLVAVRFREPERVLRGLAGGPLARKLREYPVAFERPDARLTVLRIPATRGPSAAAAAAADLAPEPDVELVTPVFSYEGSDEPLLITDEIVCQFRATVAREEQERFHRANRVSVVAPLDFAPNGFVLRVEREAAAGANAVEVANRYVESGLVEWAHADFVKPRAGKARRPPPSLLAREWHLANTGQSGGAPGADARVVAAWRETKGTPSVAVAVVDDGFDLDHLDFAPAARIVAPLDVRSGAPDPRPRRPEDNHGTCVLGVLASSGAGSGVLGVAPGVCILPVRLDGGERFEAAAIAAAVRAGAAVVNCSWGPPDGAWWDPADPLHARVVPLPDVVAAAMRFAAERGRDGRGAVLVWAAGNGNERVSNDGYAAAPWVIAVAASNHRDRRSVYSDFGPEVCVAAPSSDLDARGAVIGGIWASDRRGPYGYAPDDDATGAFGGTSAAAPIVAGIAALLLSLDPELTRDEVRSLLEETAERIDPASPSWVRRDGRWRSDLYGAGRVDAARALEAARARRPGRRSRSTMTGPAARGRVTA